ncbi:MAG: hypothetical protein HQK53_06245 [Oligoflexia bacterium]|nr:hypothetical protein [Oligoflexia bacterium]
MGKISELHYNLDSRIFKQIDVLKNSYFYNKYLELLNSLQNDTKIVINQIIVLTTILSPLFLVFILFLSNYSFKRSVQLKAQTYQTARKIFDLDREIQQNKRLVLADQTIQNTNDLEQKIREIATINKIKLDNLIIENGKSLTVAGSYSHISEEVNFVKFSINDLVQFMQNLVTQQKIKITAVTIRKEESNQLLKGKFHISHYGQLSNTIDQVNSERME